MGPQKILVGPEGWTLSLASMRPRPAYRPLKAGAGKPTPAHRSRQEINDSRDCPKAGGNIDPDVKPDSEPLSHAQPSGSTARRDPKGYGDSSHRTI